MIRRIQLYVGILFFSLSLGGCSTAVNSFPSPAVLGNAASRGPIVSFPEFRSRFPTGTRVYSGDVYVVEDGSAADEIPVPIAQIHRTAKSIMVTNTNTGSTKVYHATANVIRERGSIEWALPPTQPMPNILRRWIACGDARLLIVVPTSHTGGHRHTLEDIPPDRSGGDPVGGSGGNGGDDGGSGTPGGDITSTDDQCMSGGENLGWTVNVPSQYAGATMNICAQNSVNSVCFTWQNVSPGLHNVSAYLPGSGQASFSLGFIYGDNQAEGVGWGSDPGCW